MFLWSWNYLLVCCNMKVKTQVHGCNEELPTKQLPGVRETTNGYTTQNHKDLGSFKVTCLDGVKINISSENDPHMDLFVGVFCNNPPE